MKRNLSLDIYKLILCSFVIMVHIPGALLKDHELFNWFIEIGLSRIVVPTFFIISGYYFGKKADDFALFKKFLIHFCIVYATWYLIYLPFNLDLIKKDGEYNFFYILVSIFFGNKHLWYIPGLIHGSILFFFVKRIVKNDNILFLIAVITIFAATALSFTIDDPANTTNKFYRNGLSFGFPFIAIGYYIRKTDIINKIKGAYLIPLLVLFIILMFLDSYNLYRIGTFSDLMFSTNILSPLIFITIMKYGYMASYGSYMTELPGSIYFVHELVVTSIVTVGINSLYTVPEAYIICVLLSFIIIFMNKRIKIFL